MAKNRQRILGITLDERTVVRRNADVESERAVAIGDLLHDNRFAPSSGAKGPFRLHLGIEENRLALDIRDQHGKPLERAILPLTAFRGIVKDYFLVCGSYYDALKSTNPARLEAIDMGRRALHDEGSALLRERLADRVEVDFNTARRLFTLLCVLHIRG